MIPKSLSATAIANFEGCPARYVAESFHKVPSMSGDAAQVGTVIHAGLEEFVREAFLVKGTDPALEFLIDSCREPYRAAFGSDDKYWSDVEWMAVRWHERTVPLLEKREVLSVETKNAFALKTSAGDIPVNYIFDRIDRLPDGSVEVTDYKSIRARLAPADLEGKIQPRLYALAAQLEHPDAESVWVNFDLLRHDPIGFKFTREQNRDTFRHLKHVAEQVIATDIEAPPETINPDCRWCLKKLTCSALQANVLAGTSLAISDPLEAAKLRVRLDQQAKALALAVDELDSIILGSAKEQDVTEFEDDEVYVSIGGRRTRSIDPKAVAEVIPPEVMAKYSGLTVTNFDKMLKDDDLDPQQKSLLGGLVSWKSGASSVSVKQK